MLVDTAGAAGGGDWWWLMLVEYRACRRANIRIFQERDDRR